MLVGLVLIVGIAGLAVWGYIEAVQAEPAVVGSVGVAVIGALGVVWQQRRAEQSRLREAHRNRMTPAYEGLLGIVAEHFGSKGSDQKREKEMERFMRDLKGRQLLLGASSEIIGAFHKWQADTAAVQAAGNEVAAVVAWEDLLWAIRKDLGHNDSGLERGDLLPLFNDKHFSSGRESA